jgi:hypothetical protein
MLARKGAAMRHTGIFSAVLVLTLAALVLPPATASAADGKRPSGRHDRGNGFLPGYEPPQVVEWRRRFERRPAYWYGGPQYYRGRWNGGGFGPCWTPTPIGPHWNCG